MMTLQEMVETAIRNQPFILQEDMRRGAPLCYFKDGVFVIKYPDGTIEHYDKPCLPRESVCHA